MYIKQKRAVSFILCLALVFTGLGSMVVSAAEADRGVLDFVDDDRVNSQKQFETLCIQVGMLRKGLITVKYDMRLNNQYLVQQRNEVENKVGRGDLTEWDRPTRRPGMSEEEYQADLHDYYDRFYQRLDDSVLPRIQFELTFDKTVFGLGNNQMPVSLNVMGDKEKVGRCDFREDSKGNIVVTCTFEKIVYNRSDVDVKFSIDFDLRTDVAEGDTLRLVRKDAQRLISGQVQTGSANASGSVLSDGSLWIIVGVAAAAAAGIAALLIVKKKKPAPADGAESKKRSEEEANE